MIEIEDNLIGINAKLGTTIKRLKAELGEAQRQQWNSMPLYQLLGLITEKVQHLEHMQTLDWRERAEKAEAKNVKLKEALQWCSGSADFGPGGQAEVGWNGLCRPLLDPTD